MRKTLFYKKAARKMLVKLTPDNFAFSVSWERDVVCSKWLLRTSAEVPGVWRHPEMRDSLKTHWLYVYTLFKKNTINSQIMLLKVQSKYTRFTDQHSACIFSEYTTLCLRSFEIDDLIFWHLIINANLATNLCL